MRSAKIIGIFCLTMGILTSFQAFAQVSYSIDPTIKPDLEAMEGLNGGPTRPVGAVVAPDGSRDEFIANEVILHPASQEELEAFLSRYRGTIIRDGTAKLVPGAEPREDFPPSSGWYLVRIEPNTSTLEDFEENLEAADLNGEWVFSSEEAARLSSLAIRERNKRISPNFLLTPQQTCEVCEHPIMGGANLDAADPAGNFWWMTEDEDPAVPGNQGLSIGVIHAWEYLRYQGYRRYGVPYYPVRVAILDDGFDLDTSTGRPLNGNKDYTYSGYAPHQLDEVEGDNRAGGMGATSWAPWHGQEVFGICCAASRNSWGTAGISFPDIKTYLIRISGDFYVWAQGLYDALYSHADVVNISWSGPCNSWCDAFDDGNVIDAAVGSAYNLGVIVITGSDNDGKDISGSSIYPCTLSGSICVGAIDDNANAQSYSNWGSVLDIWAPTGTRSTVTRVSAALDADNLNIDELHVCHGTSCAAPFVAGVVAMMKMLNNDLSVSEVKTILKDTALTSSDSKVSQGYIDAFAAVEAVRPNRPPGVKFIRPENGAVVGHNDVFFDLEVIDPEEPDIPYQRMFPTRLSVSSDRDGPLCRDDRGFDGHRGCSANIRTLGSHVITATATDAFGASASNSVTIQVNNNAPIAKIIHPSQNTNKFVGQRTNLRGYGFDRDADKIAELNWTSSISGHLGKDYDIWVDLPVGSHRITLTATDVRGASGSDAITVLMQPASGHPTARILKPASTTTFDRTKTIRFAGEGTDPEDGDLKGSSLMWFSDRDGPLGTGKILYTTLSGPTCGTRPHDISLEVRDSSGRSDTHTIRVLIGTIC